MSIQDKVELELERGHRDRELHLLMEHVWEREHHQVGLHVAEHGHLCPHHGCVVEERRVVHGV